MTSLSYPNPVLNQTKSKTKYQSLGLPYHCLTLTSKRLSSESLSSHLYLILTSPLPEPYLTLISPWDKLVPKRLFLLGWGYFTFGWGYLPWVRLFPLGWGYFRTEWLLELLSEPKKTWDMRIKVFWISRIQTETATGVKVWFLDTPWPRFEYQKTKDIILSCCKSLSESFLSLHKYTKCLKRYHLKV